MTIEVSHLVKTYGGKTPVRAVRDISFQVQRGEVFGFLGPNGAGKTTTIRCMLDVLRPTSGTISIFGLDARRDALAIHARIGYLPGDVRLPGDLTAKQFLERYSHMAGLEPVLLPALLERFEVPLNRKLKGFSKGMRQMVAIIQAFMCAPELAILDEPTSGLDPLGQRAFNEFLLDQTAHGLTVFMSSHILSEVERTCHRVAVIRTGELVAIESIERLRERAGQVVIVAFADGSPEEELRAIPGVQAVEQQRNGAYHLRIAGSIDPVVKALARHTIRQLEIEEAPLEEVFLKFYTADSASPPASAEPVAPTNEHGGPAIMNTTTTTQAASAPVTRPRARGLPVLAATLRESQSLLGAACGYILIIGLFVGLVLPAFETLKIQTYLTGTLGAVIGGGQLNPHTPLLAAYLALELYGSFFLLLFGGVLAYAAGASIARNIEDGTIDLTLARPLSRTRVYLEKWAAMLVGTLIIIGTSFLTAWLCTVLYHNARLDWQWFVLANVDIAALLFVVTGMGMLVSALMSAGRAGGGVATLVVVFWYLCQTFGTTGDRLSFLKYLGPYYYAPSSQAITAEQWTDPWKLLVPVAAGLILGIAGLIYFQRRDLTA